METLTSTPLVCITLKIDFAVNDKEHKAEFKTWNDNIENIGNREKAEELGYFYAVKEAKLVEISAVLQGSNELTPTIEAKDIEPEQSTQHGAGAIHSQNK